MPVPPELEQTPAGSTCFRASDETACNELIDSHPTQKDREAGLEKVLSNEGEFPDGGLRAWAVVLGVSPCISLEGSY